MLNVMTRCRRGRDRASGFTLIEVLVVVAIIALLIAILMPSLSRAREQSRQSVCLSNLKQQGTGLSTYSMTNRGFLPWAGNFRYTLAEGYYYLSGYSGSDWARVNNGGLYPEAVGKEANIYYCPSNMNADADEPKRGMNAFLNRVKFSKQGSSGYVDSHNAANSPIGAYAYALPVLGGRHPRDAGSKMYPLESMSYTSGGTTTYSPYYKYMTDPAELSQSQADDFLGPFPQKQRGKSSMPVIMTDAYFGGYSGYHLNGYNVMFSDFHARRIPDPRGRIIKGTGGGSVYNTGDIATRGQAFMVWDYFGRNP